MRDETSSKFDQLIATLGKELQLTGREIADVLWLAQQYQTTTEEISHPNPQTKESKSTSDNTKQSPQDSTPETKTPAVDIPQPQEAQAEVYAQSSIGSSSKSNSAQNLDIKVPDAPGLRYPLKLVKALRPLIQKIDSETEIILDEEATANRIAKEGIRIPVFQPALEPAFDLMLVVDESNTMIFWRKAIQELQQLLKILGAFRDVQIWGLLINQDNGEIYLRRGMGKKAANHRHYQPRSVVDPSGKRLILVASDCVSDIWHNDKAFKMLNIWTQKHPVAIIQMLPQWLWQRTALSLGAKVQFSSLTPTIPNQDLLIKRILLWDDIDFTTGTKIPIFTLEEESAKTWSKMIAGRSDAHVTGFVFSSSTSTPPQEDSSISQTQEIESEETTEEITSNFRRTASPIARKLASLLSAAPVINLPIVRIIQAQMLPQSQQVHVAEVFLGGIIKRKHSVIPTAQSNPNNSTSDNDSPTTVIPTPQSNPNNSNSDNDSPTTVIPTQGSNPKNETSPNEEITPETNPDDIEFDFISQDVRNNFLDAAPVTDSLDIIQAISQYFAKKLGKTLEEFNALLRNPQHHENQNINIEEIKPFAFLTAKVLKRLGRDYLQFAQKIEQEWQKFDIKSIPLTNFTFETLTVNRRGEIINRETKQAQFFTETIQQPVGGEVIPLEMVYIPGGTFMMGSPEGEGDDDEKPQHEVTVPAFFMGKYQITQEQWKAVASLPQVERELDPEPSQFKQSDRDRQNNQKNNLPVENVSWYDADEFCKRLSRHTGKLYRLPTEAEWEYACRAGTTTPFHFGKTITSELANYHASYTFADESKGEYREKTTTVGQFPPNDIGLHDMHGNVWEWCQDVFNYYHNYKGTPNDGSAWLNENYNHYLVLRGGSWYSNPEYCRSACRSGSNPDSHNNDYGFRLVCDVARRTL